MVTFSDTVISEETTRFFPQSAWEKESYEKYYFGLVDVEGNSTQHDNLLYFGLFIKSSVTSDYNELNVSVTHVLHMIFYLSFLCVLWPPLLLGLWRWRVVHGQLVKCMFLIENQRNHFHLFHAEFLEQKAKFDVFHVGYTRHRFTIFRFGCRCPNADRKGIRL